MPLSKLIKKVFGDPNEKKIKEYQPIIDKINALEATIQPLSDADLKNKTAEFKNRISKGESLDSLLPEAFAVVRETAIRTVKMRHFDVQLIGGLVLHEGKITEMKTGEGKTLVATLPAYLNALEGKGVYMVTVNDYLAKRDSEWMGEIYRFLGLTVGLIQSGMPPLDRIAAYNADITFGTNNEYGFDYLRDHLVVDKEDYCQKRRHFAIIDEVDSILIDEARTPLIISGPVKDSTSKYIKVAKVTRTLQPDTHYTVDEKHKNAVLTEDGIAYIEKKMGINNIYSVKNMDVAHMCTQCLKALYLFKRDVDYVVKNNEVLIVDEFTGRLMEGRRYSDGLHQAIEATENLPIREESQTLASVTFQNYFRMFPKLAGMTGTAVTEEAEFSKIYGLEVTVIPTNKPMVRLDQSDIIYKTKTEKYKAITKLIKTLYEKEQPVLVGTIAIETSELISDMLFKMGIPHNVLNAKHHEKEAEIIANAGAKKSVTIATNMAGRGTDIKLGEGAIEAGGLFVLGSSRHESRRIDNQLRGRAGRQGDPGESRFFVSLDDDLMRLFGSDRIASIMDRLGLPEDTPIEHPLISRSIEKAQQKVEKYHFGIRKQILEYDNVINKQRETIYTLRNQILSKDNLDTKIKEFIQNTVQTYTKEFFLDEPIKDESENKEPFIQKMQSIFPISNINEMIQSEKTQEKQINAMVINFYQFYEYRKNQHDSNIFEEHITKRSLLISLDKKWMDHLYNMDILREGIGLRAWGQRDPLVEYKIEAFDMFHEMILNLSEEALNLINHSIIVDQDPNAQKEEAPLELNYNTDNNNDNQKRATEKIGRNDPCPCGSGRKHKKCCMT